MWVSLSGVRPSRDLEKIQGESVNGRFWVGIEGRTLPPNSEESSGPGERSQSIRPSDDAEQWSEHCGAKHGRHSVVVWRGNWKGGKEG